MLGGAMCRQTGLQSVLGMLSMGSGRHARWCLAVERIILVIEPGYPCIATVRECCAFKTEQSAAGCRSDALIPNSMICCVPISVGRLCSG